MADMGGQMSQQLSEINGQNIKTILDRFAGLMAQGAEDNQANSRVWNAFNHSVAQNNETVREFAKLGFLVQGQTGGTLNQDNVNPSATAAGRAVDQAGGVAASQVGANVADLATAMVPTLTAIQTALAALESVLVTATGGASTPSQTSPKPTA